MNEQVIREAAAKEMKAAITYEIIHDPILQVKASGFVMEYVLSVISKAQLGETGE